MKRAAAIALLVLTACGGGAGERANVTKRTTTSTTVASPDQRFLEHIKQRLNFENPDAEAPTTLEMAHGVCEFVDTSQTGSPGSVTQENRAALIETGLEIVMAENLDDGVTAVIMSTATEDLCPDLSVVVADYLESRGLTP